MRKSEFGPDPALPGPLAGCLGDTGDAGHGRAEGLSAATELAGRSCRAVMVRNEPLGHITGAVSGETVPPAAGPHQPAVRIEGAAPGDPRGALGALAGVCGHACHDVGGRAPVVIRSGRIRGIMRWRSARRMALGLPAEAVPPVGPPAVPPVGRRIAPADDPRVAGVAGAPERVGRPGGRMPELAGTMDGAGAWGRFRLADVRRGREHAGRCETAEGA